MPNVLHLVNLLETKPNKVEAVKIKQPPVGAMAYIMPGAYKYRYRFESVMWAGVYHCGKSGYYMPAICNQSAVYADQSQQFTNYSEAVKALRAKLAISSNRVGG